MHAAINPLLHCRLVRNVEREIMSTSAGDLMLVRHAAPVIEPERAAAEWVLSPEAIDDVHELAHRIDPERLVEIVASSEPKAASTAEVLARALGTTWRVADGLHEHERGVLPWMAEDAWRDLLAELFARPDALVFGLEPADQALQRFREAVRSVLATAGAGDVVIVTHGTVMALLLAEITGADAFEIWSGLQMPDVRSVPRELLPAV